MLTATRKNWNGFKAPLRMIRCGMKRHKRTSSLMMAIEENVARVDLTKHSDLRTAEYLTSPWESGPRSKYSMQQPC